MDAGLQAGTFQDILQNHLAPVALRLLPALQGIGQIFRFAADPQGLLHHPGEPGVQRGVQFDALDLRLLHGGLELRHLLLERIQQRFQLLFIGALQFAGLLLEYPVGEGFELFLQQFQTGLPRLFLFLPRPLLLSGKQLLFPPEAFLHQPFFRLGLRQRDACRFSLATVLFHLSGKPPGSRPRPDCAADNQCGDDKQIFHITLQKTA